MSVARARALTLHCRCLHNLSSLCVEMSVARARALTQSLHIFCLHNLSRRNECCPCEGIDTLIACPFSDTAAVEMSVARARALPHYLPQTTEYLAQQRSVLSKKSPFMAIFFCLSIIYQLNTGIVRL